MMDKSDAIAQQNDANNAMQHDYVAANDGNAIAAAPNGDNNPAMVLAAQRVSHNDKLYSFCFVVCHF